MYAFIGVNLSHRTAIILLIYWLFMKCPSLFLIILVLWSVLSNIAIATPTFCYLLFAWYIFFCSLAAQLRDLSSLTRDWTQAPAVKALSPYHWTTREFPGVSFSALSPSAYLCILKCTFCTKLHSCVLLVYSDNLFLLIYAFCPLKINVIIVCLNMSLLCWCLFSLPDRLLSTGSQRVGHDWATSLGFPGGLDGKPSAHNAGDPGSIPESGRPPGEGNGRERQPVFKTWTLHLLDVSSW